MIAILLLPALALAQTQATDPLMSLKYIDPTKDFVQIKDKGYTLLPPLLVSDGGPISTSFSSSGQSIAFLRHPNRPAFDKNLIVTNPDTLDAETLCVWNINEQKVKDLLTIDGKTTAIDQIEWLHDSDAFIVVVRNLPRESKEPTFSMYRLSALSDPQELYANSPNGIRVYASPRKPVALAYTAVLDTNQKVHEQAAILENDGTLLVPIPLGSKGISTFDSDGNLVLLESSIDPETRKRKMVLHPIDLKTGEPQMDKLSASQTIDRGLAYNELPTASTWISTNSLSPVPRFKATVKSEWLRGAEKSDNPVALISAGSDDSTLSPALNAVAYVTQGTLFVRELRPLDLTVMKAMAEAARRDLAMSQAKQMGTACMMFAADYDGQMPGMNEFATQIDPYVKNPDMVSGFTYTNNLSAIPAADAATIVIGFVQTGTGRAVVFGDGHVRWQG